jgi:7-cyano-7-deazaguanine synthase in queuosine biosynthesis
LSAGKEVFRVSASTTKPKLNRTALVVFSGGQDSTTCLHWALGAFASVEAIYFDYGQRHASEERAAQVIAWRNQVPLRRFRLDFFRELGGNALTDSSMTISTAMGTHGPARRSLQQRRGWSPRHATPGCAVGSPSR